MSEVACTVNGEKCLFHCWEQRSWVIEPSFLKGGCPGGQMSQVFGIVEFRDGSEKRVDPTQIRFSGVWLRIEKEGDNNE